MPELALDDLQVAPGGEREGGGTVQRDRRQRRLGDEAAARQ